MSLITSILSKVKALSKIFIFLIALKLYDYLFADKVSDHLEITFHRQVDFGPTTIISAVLIAPLIEEFIFRLPLTKDERLNWLILIPVIIQLLVLNNISPWLLLIPILIVLFALVYMVKNKMKLSVFVGQNLVVLSFIISVFFSWTHAFLLGEFGLTSFELLYITLIAYFPLSLLLAYTRIKHGILYAVLLHSVFNLGTIILNPLVYG